MTDDAIVMQVPATAQSTPLLRLAGAQLASQCGFDYDRVEDVRIALSESVRILIGAPTDADTDADGCRLDAVFTVGPATLTVRTRLVGDHLVGDRAAVGAAADSQRILEATTTSFAVDPTPGSAEVTVHFDRSTASGTVRERPSGREG